MPGINPIFNSMYGNQNQFDQFGNFNGYQNYQGYNPSFNYGNNNYNVNQQSVQRNQNVAIPGKVVESFEVFKSMDIPFDGNVYYFPKADGTEIYTKRWLNNGTTEQLVFKIFQENQEIKEDPVITKLNSIDERIAKIEEMFNKPVQSKTKKGEVTE